MAEFDEDIASLSCFSHIYNSSNYAKSYLDDAVTAFLEMFFEKHTNIDSKRRTKFLSQLGHLSNGGCHAQIVGDAAKFICGSTEDNMFIKEESEDDE